MKFFTPELFVQGNSSDDDVIDYVEAEWERRTKRYKRHYKKIETQLPLILRKFHEEQSLHDADVFAPAFLPRNAPWNGREVVIVAQQINTLFAEYINTLAFLEYTITADPVITVPVDSPIFKKRHPIWLYDEVDLIEPGIFAHEILISDGRVVKIVFSDFNYHIAPLCPETPAAAQAQPQQKQQMASA
jgi:hypothetical protein